MQILRRFGRKRGFPGGKREEDGKLTASAVEGKKSIVSSAILFMAELSRPVSWAIRCCIKL